ncbi:MAG: DEAD/DEAH box helicase family protein [Anaerolineae bacterium]|nr:DEAD/DEAH box helicase family protein [Anaerolineae bacterium]NUQ04740.1 DEAD/DEAH box helicase family protein [Anaerolineae bacterium]
MIKPEQLTPLQSQAASLPATGRFFLEGPAGTGKTTAAVARLLRLLNEGAPADSILIVAPQPTLALPYIEALRRADLPPGGQARITTLSGIAREMIALFWGQVAPSAGFASAAAPPTFLSLETAQYVMAQIVDPLVEDQGYFETVTLPRGRLYSQLIDNLNKAAVVGFPHTEVAERLKPAWAGDPASLRMYDEVQDAINRFRAYCLNHNLLDFSLLIETFMRHGLPVCSEMLFRRASHLILENVEEDTPAAHQVFRSWLARCESALVLFDSDAGYRRFLGADEDSASGLRAFCDQTLDFSDSLVASPSVQALTSELARIMGQYAEHVQGDPAAAFDYDLARFAPESLDWAAKGAAELIRQGAPPGEIVIVAPFMSDALRFSLIERLRERGVTARSHRPSRALRDEPVVRAMLALARLANPAWGLPPDARDLAYALMASLSAGETGALDLARAHLLAFSAYPKSDHPARLAPFESLPPEIQERITYTIGEKYDRLREWLEAHIRATAAPPTEDKPKRGRRKTVETTARLDPALDHFFSRLFGEVLSARGFGLHKDLIAADAVAALVESARGFRAAMERIAAFDSPAAMDDSVIAREYVRMVEAGVIANQYIGAWQRPDADAVLVAPAYTFLMNNRPAAHQFWLDAGGRGWSERIYQPLTHPVVLSRTWAAGDVWDGDSEDAYRRETLFRLVVGLLRRCRTAVHLGIAELSETGGMDQGLLIEVFNRLLRRLNVPGDGTAGSSNQHEGRADGI